MTVPPNWRTHSAKVITRVIRTVGTADRQALQRAISEAYPFGERRNYPYRVWLDEVKKHLAWVEQGRFEPRPPVGIQQGLFDSEGL